MGESDQKLLQRFLRHDDESAFREFVARYAGLVQQVALRRTGKRQLAEEVSQNVFCAVVKKAEALCKHPERIPGWLHRAALFESSKVMRKESSFQKRKKMQHPDDIQETGEPNQAAWKSAMPHLDSALDRLSDSERQLILLHYFEGKTFPQIAAQQSRPAGTVQKQCRRAVEKLSHSLKKKGVVLSATALAAGLCPQLAEASSTAFVKTVSTHALLEATNYSSVALTTHLFMKSKFLTTTAAAVVLLPLLLQQAGLARDWSENRQLKKELVTLRAGASPQSTKSQPRSVSRQRISSGKMTLERLRYALEQGEKRGTMKFLDFEEMIASLSVEDLRRLTPEALALPRRRGRQNLCEYLIAEMGLKDPEGTVRLVTEFSQEHPFVLNLGVEQALARWTDKDPDEVIDWLLELHPKAPEPELQEYGLMPYQGIVLSILIEEGSDRVREVLALNTKYDPSYVIREALDDARDEFRESNGVVEQVRRFEAFLPWVREFGKEGSRGAGESKSGLLQSMLSRVASKNRVEVIELLLTTGNLFQEERDLIVKQQSKWFLEQPFQTSGRVAWDKAEESARDFLNAYEPEQAESYFKKARSSVLKRERRLAEDQISRLEQHHEKMRDSDLRRELMSDRFAHFPDLLEKGLKISEEIENPEEKRKAKDYLEEQLQLREEES